MNDALYIHEFGIEQKADFVKHEIFLAIEKINKKQYGYGERYPASLPYIEDCVGTTEPTRLVVHFCLQCMEKDGLLFRDTKNYSYSITEYGYSFMSMLKHSLETERRDLEIWWQESQGLYEGGKRYEFIED